VNLEPDAYDEIVRRLVDLRNLSRELIKAYDDPVTKKGVQEMHDSLERVLQLLGRK
jgi:hypothetical protein